MNPITNFEKWINSIATGTAPDIPPVTRLEHFLDKIRLAIARKSDITCGGVFEVIDTVTGDTHTLDKTFGEIEAAINAGKTVWIVDGSVKYLVVVFEPIARPKDNYAGSIRTYNNIWIVSGDTEEEARNSYPSYEIPTLDPRS